MDLTGLSIPELEKLRAAAARTAGVLTDADVVAAGLGHHASIFRNAPSLPGPAWLVIAGAVLAERQRRDAMSVELVWTGPDHQAGTTRDTAVTVRRLFEEAQQSVVVAGFSFHGASGILEPLHASMKARGVRSGFFIHVDRPERGAIPEEHARNFFRKFLETNWPFGPPFPELFYDPRTATPGSVVSMHAKAVVVDESTALVTSANFTERAQDRNIEVGALIRGGTVPKELVTQLRALVVGGHLRTALPLMSPPNPGPQ